MIEFRPFRAGHLDYLTPQASQVRDHGEIVASGQAVLLEPYTALSAWRGLVCIGCAGLITIRPHRAMAWALLGEGAGRDMLCIARKVKRVIAAAPYKRVEFTVAEGFENGHRFARALGAIQETPNAMRGFGPYGNAEFMYSIVRE